MGKDTQTIRFRVVQTNAATAAETTNSDKEGNVTGIDRKIYEDVRISVAGIDSGDEGGGGRFVGGELVISAPEGAYKVGQTLEADLKVVDEDAGVGVPTTASEGSTLRQDDEEARRGRRADGSLGPEPKGESPSRSSSRRPSKRPSKRPSRRSGKAKSPQQTDQAAGSSSRPAA